MAMTVPYPTGAAWITMGEPRPAYAYVGGERSDRRVMDSRGRPVSRVSAVGCPAGDDVSTVTIEIPDDAAGECAGGRVIALDGDQLGMQLSGGDFGSIRVKIFGADAVRVLGQAAPLLLERAK